MRARELVSTGSGLFCPSVLGTLKHQKRNLSSPDNGVDIAEWVSVMVIIAVGAFCSERTRSELDMVVMGQLMAGINDDEVLKHRQRAAQRSANLSEVRALFDQSASG